MWLRQGFKWWKDGRTIESRWTYSMIYTIYRNVLIWTRNLFRFFPFNSKLQHTHASSTQRHTYSCICIIHTQLSNLFWIELHAKSNLVRRRNRWNLVGRENNQRRKNCFQTVPSFPVDKKRFTSLFAHSFIYLIIEYDQLHFHYQTPSSKIKIENKVKPKESDFTHTCCIPLAVKREHVRSSFSFFPSTIHCIATYKFGRMSFHWCIFYVSNRFNANIPTTRKYQQCIQNAAKEWGEFYML